MNMRVAEHFGMYYARLPLNQSATIVHGNALRIDWEDVVPKRDLSYILGNPPFVGSNNLNVEQRKEIESLFPQNKTVDYVSAWYLNAAKYIYHTQILAAFVSTNSITQGEQVAILWKTLFEVYKITIDFAYRTFKWSNEAKGKAAVHCIIVGFSNVHKSTLKVIYDNDGKKIKAENISPYLINAPNIIIESHNKPICDVPKIQKGNQPTDGGNLIIEENEIDDFLAKEPLAKPFIKRLIGAQEYINNKKRYCLWLINVPPDSLRKMPLVMERINKVREIRLASPDSGARRLAETPMLFRETNNPETFVVVPSVSSERRKYIPIGFLDKDTIPTNLVLIIPDATLYHFGILTSNVHMAWTRAICGRLKSDYRYSKDIVYNNFPWPHITDIQKATIETAAQNVLNARSLFPNSSLADLYDPLTMPPELLKAHKALDRAVMKLYGFPVKKDFTEADCVAALMERYKELVEENKK
ncbi:MAG: class I SAM-dependent DNA methyltransferase, partial [Clostridiales bacterium]|jgi:hypothetical protein|nr:class I SAM-dependent DNA methyltransferase [Clostridiales bacterium]